MAEAIRRTAGRVLLGLLRGFLLSIGCGLRGGIGGNGLHLRFGARGGSNVAESHRAGVEVPRAMSVAAVGWTNGDYPCTGYFADAMQQAAAIAEILRSGQTGRPTTLWLAGALVDRGTTASLIGEAAERRLPASACRITLRLSLIRTGVHLPRRI